MIRREQRLFARSVVLLGWLVILMWLEPHPSQARHLLVTVTGPGAAGATVCLTGMHPSLLSPTQVFYTTVALFADQNGLAHFTALNTSDEGVHYFVYAFKDGIEGAGQVTMTAAHSNHNPARITIVLNSKPGLPNRCRIGEPQPLRQSGLPGDRVNQVINLFPRELWPVFSHHRCINCHGAVVPGDNQMRVNHSPATGSCASCHNQGDGLTIRQTNEWRLATATPFGTRGPTFSDRSAYFTLKSWQEVCRLLRTRVSGPSTATHHVWAPGVEDSLIGWGFRPVSAQRAPGGGVPRDNATFPATVRLFLERFQKWVQQGRNCGELPQPGGPPLLPR